MARSARVPVRTGSSLRDEIQKRQPFANPGQEAVLNLLRTHDVIQGAYGRVFKAHGLSAPQYNALRILRGEGQPLACLEIASRMITREPDMTRLLDRLEQKGLVRRARTEHDRRVVLVSLTEAGHARLAPLDPLVEDLDSNLLGHLSADELNELNRLLVKARQPAGPTTTTT